MVFRIDVHQLTNYKLTNDILLGEHFNFMISRHQISEFAFKTCSTHDVVVDPVVIAAAWFAKNNAVVFKTVVGEPGFCNRAVFFGSAGEKENDMAFFVPAIECFEGIRVWIGGGHTFGFFIGHIVTNGAVDVDQVIFQVWQKFWTDALAVLIESFLQVFCFYCVITHDNLFFVTLES